MKAADKIKSHLGLISFITVTVLLTLYLGISLLIAPPKKTTTTTPVVPPVEEVVPEDSQEPVVEVPEEPGESFTEGNDFEENRTQFVFESVDVIEGHNKIVSNSHYDLYLKESTLSLILRNAETGAVLYSTVSQPGKSNDLWRAFVQSGVVMEYLVGTNIVTYQADMFSKDIEIKTTLNDTGFESVVFFKDLELGYTLKVSLEDSDLIVSIPKESIVENGDKNKVSSFFVYPFMGYTKMDENEGYMFIPDGTGSLIYLEDNDGKFKQPYSEMVYGSNIGIDDPYVLNLYGNINMTVENQKILMPVYGMVHTDQKQGFVSIIEEGDVSAKIEAYPNGAILPYNWITNKFIYRQFYNQSTSKTSGTMVVRQEKINDFNIKLNFKLIDQEDATYTGMAKEYRTYLEEKDVLNPIESVFKPRFDILGSDVKKGLFFESNVTMTSFNQVEEILESLQEMGVDQFSAIYKGWQKNGIYGGLPNTSLSVNKKLGSQSQLLSLLEKYDSDKQTLSLYDDALRLNPSKVSQIKYDIVKKQNRRIFDENIHGKVYRTFNYLTPETTSSLLDAKLSDFTSKGVNNVLISGMSDNLFSYSHERVDFGRVHTAKIYYDSLKKAAEEINLSLQTPFAYLWDVSDEMLDMPVTSSNFSFSDEEVPFLAIVLRGSANTYSEHVNFEANKTEFFLKLVEQGVNPSFVVTKEKSKELQDTNSSSLYRSYFEDLKDEIQYYNDELSGVHAAIENSKILDFKRVDGMSVVSYENGTTVLVNFSEHDVVYEGTLVPALDYEVIE